MSARAGIAATSATKPGRLALNSVVSGSSTAELDTAITGKTNDSAVSPAVALQPPLGAHLVSRTARLFEAAVWRWLSLLTDAIVACLAASAAVVEAPAGQQAARWPAVLFPVITVAVIAVRRGGDDRLYSSRLETGVRMLAVVSFSTMLTIALATLGGAPVGGLAVRLWLYACVFLSLERIVLLSIRREAARSEALATRTLIVGAGVVGHHLAHRLIRDRGYLLRPVGFLDSDPLPEAGASSAARRLPLLGGIDDLGPALASTGARHVIFAFSVEKDHQLAAQIVQCQELGIGVSVVPRLYEWVNNRATLDRVGGIPLVTLHPTDPRGWEFAVKHALDRVFAAAALIVLSPLMLLVAAAVRLSSPGPILFRQRRVGRDGQVFDLLKFRTMKVEDPASSESAPGFRPLPGAAPGGVEADDRRTRVGCWLRRSSVDELPQLINVLRGGMSLVGPRPERPEFVERFSCEVARYEQRHRVRSGITGWAQVNGLRGQTSIDDRVEWDNYYIQNWSLRLDGRIMLMTLAEILRLRG
jgi:exopolysaccharide biosynthesis polyprenyl glycosylphosphotransferase